MVAGIPGGIVGIPGGGNWDPRWDIGIPGGISDPRWDKWDPRRK